MTSKEISKEHRQSLFYSFERNENINSFLMVLSYLNISFMIYTFIRMEVEEVYLPSITSLILLFLITITIRYKFSLHLNLNRKKNKKLIRNVKKYLISGKKEKNKKLQKILDRLKLTERHYKMSFLIYVAYFMLSLSIEFFILGIPSKIVVFTHSPNDYNGISLVVLFLVELITNFLILFLQTVRNLTFYGIRQLRTYLIEIVTKELEKIEEKIEKLMDLKLGLFKFNEKRLLKYLQKWNDVYFGSFFIGLSKRLLIPDYNSLVFTLENEMYYSQLLSNLKLKIEQASLSNSTVMRKSQEEKELTNTIYNSFNNNVKLLDTSIKFRRMFNDERRNKIRIIQIWIGFITIGFSIMFSLSEIPSLFGF